MKNKMKPISELDTIQALTQDQLGYEITREEAQLALTALNDIFTNEELRKELAEIHAGLCYEPPLRQVVVPSIYAISQSCREKYQALGIDLVRRSDLHQSS